MTHWGPGRTHPWGFRGTESTAQLPKHTPHGVEKGLSVSCLSWVRRPSVLPPILLPQQLVCAQPEGVGGGPALMGHCQVGLLPLPNTHSLLPTRGLGCPALSRATMPPYQGETVGATQRWQCWHLALSQGSVTPGLRTWRAPAAHPASRQGSCTTPPIMLRTLCGNWARIPGPCTYSYNSAFLLFGCRVRRDSLGPGKWGCV